MLSPEIWAGLFRLILWNHKCITIVMMNIRQSCRTSLMYKMNSEIKFKNRSYYRSCQCRSLNSHITGALICHVKPKTDTNVDQKIPFISAAHSLVYLTSYSGRSYSILIAWSHSSPLLFGCGLWIFSVPLCVWALTGGHYLGHWSCPHRTADLNRYWSKVTGPLSLK